MGRHSKKKDKKDRQSMQNWVEGARETILAAWVSPMADAMAQGWQAQDQVLRACTNEYHAKVSWCLQDHEEPSLPLPAYDPKNPPAEEDLSDADLVLKRERVILLNQRIRRWLIYRIKRLSKRVWSRARRTTDPFALLLAKLSGLYGEDTPLKKEVLKMYDEDVLADSSVKRSGTVTKKTAADNAVTAKKAFEVALKAPVSERPEDIQSCINNLLTFIAPIMTGIAERTKLQCFFVAGGMIPKADGEIGTKHYSVGSNAATGVSFTKWKDSQFDTNVLAPFKEYLEGVYPKKDRKKAAIPDAAAEAAAGAAIAALDEAVVGLGDGMLPEGGDEDDKDQSSGDDDDDNSSGDELSNGEDTSGGRSKRKCEAADEPKGLVQRDARKVEGKKGGGKKKRAAGRSREKAVFAKDPNDEKKEPLKKRPKPNPAEKPVVPDETIVEEPTTVDSSEPDAQVDPSWIQPLPPAEVLAMMHESDVDFTDTEFVAAWEKAKKGGQEDLGAFSSSLARLSFVDDAPFVAARPITPEPPWSPERPPADCPDWFHVLFEDFASVHFQSYECWSDWNRILANWVELEKSYGWKEEGAFTAAARPKEVT
ncbi:hypothetical protein C8J56DRAFT_1048421 [Mycena floridula]|nr:hypothetical protein C8J56DRAFT_1048421 [Mycena floridula]